MCSTSRTVPVGECGSISAARAMLFVSSDKAAAPPIAFNTSRRSIAANALPFPSSRGPSDLPRSVKNTGSSRPPLSRPRQAAYSPTRPHPFTEETISLRHANVALRQATWPRPLAVPPPCTSPGARSRGPGPHLPADDVHLGERRQRAVHMVRAPDHPQAPTRAKQCRGPGPPAPVDPGVSPGRLRSAAPGRDDRCRPR